MLSKRWNILPYDQALVDKLRSELNISEKLCRILTQRGISSYALARDYFRPQPDQLHSPWLMKDMDKAVSRIIRGIESRERILVFGDYDVDGTTAVAGMFSFLREIYDPACLEFYIPHRYREGYGISRAGIDYAKANGFTLIIALDCGIKSAELIAYASTLHIDFIVCDHHLPGQEIPVASAILNPKQADCPYPYKELCGCGVGFKLMCALAEKLLIPQERVYEYLDLVATAIAADIVPMTGENRILAYYGLLKINERPNPGIAALIKLGNIITRLTITNVVFVIAPRINAAGRMDDARKAVELFIEKDPVKALAIGETLHTDNADRKETDSSITEEALSIIQSDPALQKRKTSVMFRDHWHKGVVGIVASRLIEHYYRPTIVLTKSGDVLAGSARSVPGFNLYEAIYACREYLLGYGGHFAAAGLSLLPENLDAFSRKFEEVVDSSIDPRLLIPEIIIDTDIDLSEISQGLYNIIAQMEPFGPENMRPVFIAKNVKDSGHSKILKDAHIRFALEQNGHKSFGIGFNMAEKFHILQSGKPFDIVFSIEENDWNGEKRLQLKVIDLRESKL